MRYLAGRQFIRSPLLIAAACLVFGSGAGRAAEPREKFEWPGWQIPGTKIVEKGALEIVADPEAESQRETIDKEGKKTTERVALMQRVSRRRIARDLILVARTPSVRWADIAPGVYRISARVNFEGETGLIGTPILLSVDAPYNDSKRSWQACDFTEAGKYRVLSFLYEVSPEGDVRCEGRRGAGTPWSTRRRAMGVYAKAYPNSDVAAQLRTEPAKHVPPHLRISLTLPKTKYLVKEGLPPNSLRWLRLDWIKMEKVAPAGPITVRYVKAKKAWLRPGESNVFTVSLKNYTPQKAKRQVVVSLKHGLDRRFDVHTAEVELAPGESKVLSVPWKTTEKMPIWGYEVRAESRDGDKVESASRDFFSLHPQVYAVHIMGSNIRSVDPFHHPETYENLNEWYGITSGDCAQVVPKRDAWVWGMRSSGGWCTIKYLRAAIDQAHESGIAQHMYLFAGGCSTPMMEMYARTPEFAHGPLVATDQIYRKIRARENEIWNHDFEKSMPKEMSLEGGHPHVEHPLNHWFPELKKRIEQQTLEMIRKSGYDGIRFDVGIFSPKSVVTPTGEKLPYDMAKAMDHAAKNFEDFKDVIRAEFPHFEFGANMDSWFYLEQVGNRKVTPKPPETYPEFMALARCGGMFMDEGTMNAPFFDHYMNRFEDAIWSMSQKAECCRRCGGVYQLFSPHRDSTGHFAHDDIYFAVMIIASGSHYVGRFSAPPYSEGSIGEFATRYSEFFWSKGLRLLSGAAEKITVDADEEVWYAETAVWEDVGPKRRYVIPLVNPPVNERMRLNKTNELPPPITEPFDITIAMPDGFTKAEAWMLTWEPRVTAQRVPATVAGRTLKVRFPALQLFRTLVVEFSK